MLQYAIRVVQQSETNQALGDRVTLGGNFKDPPSGLSREKRFSNHLQVGRFGTLGIMQSPVQVVKIHGRPTAIPGISGGRFGVKASGDKHPD